VTLVNDNRGADVAGRHPGSVTAKAGRRTKVVDALSAWALLAPALILFTIFILIPTLTGIAISFYHWRFLDTPTPAGFDNFARLLKDPDVWQSLGVTVKFVVLGVIPTILLGFMLAVLVNANMPRVGLLRVLYFVPAVVSVAVSAVLWAFIFDGRRGPIAALLHTLGLPPIDFLNDQTWAVPALVVIMIWLALPVVIVLYLAALQRISPDIYAAAALDGAGAWRILWSITWPNVRGTTVVVAILQVINFVSGALDLALILTNGDPLGSTRALGLYAYLQAFRNTDAGYASALSVLQLVVVVTILAVARLVTRRLTR